VSVARSLFLMAAMTACASAHNGEPSVSAVMGLPQQDSVRLVLQTLSGQPVDVADHRGKAVLLVAFSTDSMACQATLRSLERVARRHPETLAAIAIAGDTGDSVSLHTTLSAYRDVLGLERTVITLADSSMREGTSVLGLIEHVPTVFFLNRLGVVVRRLEGLLTDAQIERLIAPAIPPGG
jgi:hypothetical protein